MPPRKKNAPAPEEPHVTADQAGEEVETSPSDADEEVIPEGQLVCELTGELKKETEQERTLQSFIKQLHREYHVAIGDMVRDVRVSVPSDDDGRRRNRTASLVVYAPGQPHEPDFVTHVIVVAPPTTKADEKTIRAFELMLASFEREHVYGAWTNGRQLAFRMTEATEGILVGDVELTDFPGPEETLSDLDSSRRKALRIAYGDSLQRTFQRCHDYLYGNRAMRGDRAFWQLVYLIFAKLEDESGSSRDFFVGATERNTAKGQKAIADRVRRLFERVKERHRKDDLFNERDRIELEDRELSWIAAELGRYELKATDTDSKGLAYETITSTTLKRERGQFFTPRNVIKMMVEIADPGPRDRVLDPACGSGGFLVSVLAHVRKKLLAKAGFEHVDQPLPRELARIQPDLTAYAREHLFGIDVDPDLKKAARMNMIMNNDGEGHIYHLNSLELGLDKLATAETRSFEAELARLCGFKKKPERRDGGYGVFDFVFTNPPFGAKIPIDDRTVLERFDLARTARRQDGEVAADERTLQKKVPPEILFIEACHNLLKPGGLLAIVLPNGILGNPGAQMEYVRQWMLEKMELVASVDLPAEAFLPQVSVQASCVFLRRRREAELRLTGGQAPKNRPVFMAIAEECGHGRRGEERWRRNDDGSERFEPQDELIRWEGKDGRPREERRRRQMKLLADDLPEIAREYHRMRQAGELGGS